MKKSKKPLIGIILIGVGVLSVVGVPSSDNKIALIVGILALIAVGAVLLIIGLKQNKKIESASSEKEAAIPVPTVQRVKLTVEAPGYGGDEVFKCFLVRVDELNIIERGEGYMFDVIFDEDKYKFVAFDKDGGRLGDLPSNARESLTEGERYEGKILYLDDHKSTTTAKVEIYK